jgi:hypothetical protein
VTFVDAHDARNAICEYDGTNASGQPIRLTLLNADLEERRHDSPAAGIGCLSERVNKQELTAHLSCYLVAEAFKVRALKDLAFRRFMAGLDRGSPGDFAEVLELAAARNDIDGKLRLALRDAAFTRIDEFVVDSHFRNVLSASTHLGPSSINLLKLCVQRQKSVAEDTETKAMSELERLRDDNGALREMVNKGASDLRTSEEAREYTLRATEEAQESATRQLFDMATALRRAREVSDLLQESGRPICK